MNSNALCAVSLLCLTVWLILFEGEPNLMQTLIAWLARH